MRKQIIAVILSVLLIITIPVTVYATTPRTCSVFPSLSFSSRTATCKVNITGYSSTDNIELIVKLWDGTRCLKTWTDDGIGYILFKETYNVTSGGEYTLTADITINGSLEPQISISATCE